MTIIAWDGKILAADRQATHAEMRRVTKKLHIVDGNVLAFTGNESAGMMLLEWWKGSDNQNPPPWPACQATAEWARLIVVSVSGAVSWYEENPVSLHIETGPFAWGSGRDFAIGAMAVGADAIEAVRVASRFNVSCGMGVDWFNVRTRESGQEPP